MVVDESGGSIGGASLSAINQATNAVRTTVSNEAGVYAFPALPPALYTIRAEADGFRAAVRTVEIQVQQSARLDFTLQVGEVTETVEVSGSAQLLSAGDATVGTVIENKRIIELPLNGRNFLQLVSLAPNVSFGFPAAGQANSRQGGIRAEQSISVAGQRAQFNRYTLDGVENTDPNFNTFVVLPSVDALQEFKVQSGVYPAEFGRGVTQINVSTKSGSNEYHGALFHFLRNERLDAKNYAFTSARPEKDPFKLNQFGFTLGGPVRIPGLVDGRNRAFFMTNYEWFRQRRNIQSVASVPSELMRAGQFAELPLGTQGIFDPLSRRVEGSGIGADPFPNNAIPQTRFSPVSTRLLEFLPSPNLINPDLRNNFVQAQGRPINRDQFVGRFDFIESSNSQWSGRYSWGSENQTSEGLRLNGSKIITGFNQVMVSNTRVLSPSMVNETRFGYTGFDNSNGTELAFTRDVVSELGIPGLVGGPGVQWGIPNISLQGLYTGFGNSSEGPFAIDNKNYQIINNFSMVRGKHSLKFGGEVRRDQFDQVGNQFARGQFTFQRNATANLNLPGITGDPFADFLLGQTFQAEAAVSIAESEFRNTSFSVYIDDTWKITPRLTVNLGLRYELTPPWRDRTGNLFNGIVRQDAFAENLQDPNLFPFFLRQGDARQDCFEGINLRWPDIETRCDGSLGDRLIRTDRNDFAPRFGVSWSPTDKWVLRTGGGLFYSQDSGNPRFDMSRNLAGRLRDNSSPQFPNLTFDNALSSIAGGVAEVFRPFTFANEVNRRTPYTMQYLFNVQRELPGNSLFEIGYLGSVSRHLESLRAVNEATPADPNVDSRSIPLRSPFPNFGRIQLVDNGGTGSYNSLGTKFTKRYSSGITYLVSYTYSKSLDTSTAIRNQGGDTLFPQNSRCRACEKALSSHDTRQRFVTSLLWDVPVGKGRSFEINNGLLNAIVGGWQLGSIFTVQNGFPLTVTNGQDTSNTGAFFDRPNSTGQNAELPRSDRDPQRFFNTGAFTTNLPGTHGNVGRNTLTGPGIVSWDFSSLKNFYFDETRFLQFRFEAFNLPNRANFNNPNANIASNNFGVITSTRTNMRNLQFALKLVF